MAASTAFSEDALNRYRITHSDRELRPLLRRLHRAPHLPATSQSSSDPNTEVTGQEAALEAEMEREMLRLEVLKWKIGVERLMGGVGNLGRQREAYLSRVDDTVRRTEEMRLKLEEEKRVLAAKQRERDWLLKCDEVAAKITARGKTRAELDEYISDLRVQVADHAASHATYLQTAQSRIESFAQLAKLVEDCRATKLPIEPHSTLPPPDEDPDKSMDVDDPASDSPPPPARLSAQALPFQPVPHPSTPASRAATPPPSARPSPVTSASASASTSRPSRPIVSPNANLPARLPPPPSRNVSINNPSLPARPSALRSSTTPAGKGAGSLEEGEVGEDGEVSEVSRGVKRPAVEAEARTRSMRRA